MKPWYLILTAVLILLCIQSVSAEEGKSYLTIDSIPGGADLHIANSFVGYTPEKVEVPGGGTVAVTVQRHGGGYEVWSGSVYVPKGEEVTYMVRLYKTEDRPQKVGYLVVNSPVEGAEVYLDNGYIGTITDGSVMKDEVRLGRHYVQVLKDGYHEFSTFVEVIPKNMETANVYASLQPVVDKTPATISSVPPPAPTKSRMQFFVFIGVLFAIGLVRKEMH